MDGNTEQQSLKGSSTECEIDSKSCLNFTEFSDKNMRIKTEVEIKTEIITDSESNFDDNPDKCEENHSILLNNYAYVSFKEEEDASVVTSELDGQAVEEFAFVSCDLRQEVPQSYCDEINNYMDDSTISVEVQTDVNMDFDDDQLMKFSRLSKDKILFFTGLSSHKFRILLNFLLSKERDNFFMKYLSNDDQLLLTLFKYQHNPDNEYLALLFDLTLSQVQKIINHLTNKFMHSINDVTQWSIDSKNVSLHSVLDCRRTLKRMLKNYLPKLSDDYMFE